MEPVALYFTDLKCACFDLYFVIKDKAINGILIKYVGFRGVIIQVLHPFGKMICLHMP